jgi:hypothetical protein
MSYLASNIPSCKIVVKSIKVRVNLNLFYSTLIWLSLKELYVYCTQRKATLNRISQLFLYLTQTVTFDALISLVCFLEFTINSGDIDDTINIGSLSISFWKTVNSNLNLAPYIVWCTYFVVIRSCCEFNSCNINSAILKLIAGYSFKPYTTKCSNVFIFFDSKDSNKCSTSKSYFSSSTFDLSEYMFYI